MFGLAVEAPTSPSPPTMTDTASSRSMGLAITIRSVRLVGNQPESLQRLYANAGSSDATWRPLDAGMSGVVYMPRCPRDALAEPQWTVPRVAQPPSRCVVGARDRMLGRVGVFD